MWAFWFCFVLTYLWRRKWQPTPVSLPGESHGWRAWWATVHRVSKSQTQLKWLSTSVGLACRNKRNFFNYFLLSFPSRGCSGALGNTIPRISVFLIEWDDWNGLHCSYHQEEVRRRERIAKGSSANTFQNDRETIFLKRKKKRFWLIGDCWGKIVRISGIRSCQAMVSESLLVLTTVPETQEVSWIWDTANCQ